MLISNYKATIGSGYPLMNALIHRLALVAAVALPATSALAADLDVPPPVDDLRPATYDWTGLNIGIFASAIAIDGFYGTTQVCDDPSTPAIETCAFDPDMSGIGYGFGARAGFDYQVDNFVWGIQGDWTFAGEIANNEDPDEMSYMKMNNLGTLRARAGIADGNSLLYVTGGLAVAEMEFGGLIGPSFQPNREDVSDPQWTWGWALGAGIEHAFSDSLTASLEYLYINLDDTEHTLFDSSGVGGTVDMQYNDMHVIRAGLNYRFTL